MAYAIHAGSLEREIAYRQATGMVQVSLFDLEEKVGALGYRLDPVIRGPNERQPYPSWALYLAQADDGLGFEHQAARRDEKFQALTDLRDTHFAVHNGYIYEF